MTRSVLLVALVLVACAPEIEAGLFDSMGSPPVSTTVASGGGGDDRSDDDTTASESSGDAEGPGGPTPTSVETSSAPTGPEPTFGDLEESSAGGMESTGDATMGDATTGVDPTGVDPTGVDPSGGGGGDCCSAQFVPGCEDPNVEACVCALDDYCCSNEWDEVCVDIAGSCGGGCVGGGGAACCIPQLLPGCGDAAIEACVCGLDGFCCAVEWDDLCVLSAGDCGAPC